MTDDLADRAAALDAADQLAGFRDEFIGSDDPAICAYLDGNSLGRPLRATRDRIGSFVEQIWGKRLIRAWDEGWMDDPIRIGDEIGRVALGAAPGQTVVGDSTSVMLYKWIRAALASQPGRDEIIVDIGNFPTDRFVVEGIAAELGMQVRWLRAERSGGITADQVSEVVGFTHRALCSATWPIDPDIWPTYPRSPRWLMIMVRWCSGMSVIRRA